MRTYNTKYINKKELELFLQKHEITKAKNILIQIFTGIIEEKYIQNLLDIIKQLIPKAKIIGTTSDGIITNKKILQIDTLLSFSVFESTSVDTFFKENKKSSYKLGLDISSNFKKFQNKKAAICFSDGINTNGEEFLKGVEKHNKKLIIAGGLAGDNGKMKKTYVFTQDAITDNGAVCALLCSKKLIVNMDYNFGWENIGKYLTVTKSKKNRVYTIDNIKAVDLYKKYLGENIGKELPLTGIEFPLIMRKNGLKVARAVIQKHNDGSLSFAGNVDEGSKVQFGYGNINNILNKNDETYFKIIEKPIESIFIYSCMARKKLLDEKTIEEIIPYSNIVDICGFFTYGEFYTQTNRENHCLFLNQTKTLLTLSEDENSFKQRHFHTKKNNKNNETIEALSNLISQTSKELMEQNEAQAKTIQNEIEKNRQKDQLIMNQSKLASMGEMTSMIAHQWRQPLNAISSVVSALIFKNSMNDIEKEFLDKKLKDINSYTQHLSSTISDFREFFKTDKEKEDIELKKLIESLKNIIEDSFYNQFIKLNIDISDNIPVFKGYENELKQVILNLVKNAKDSILKNKIENRMVKIRAFEKKDLICVEVEDNGAGVKDEIKEKIFEPYFSTKEKDGMGIGLYMSKIIIEQHLKGKLSFKNIDNGVIFIIEIKKGV